ncbi:hypothetical protein L6452_17824 [Arctium lappa]|uniref:Uncharacterized protein n=1 Tax=Arctium lappa TaxID=4217 RepID=A0ACB9C4H2_ARCLA|nr:hypothetical protein L6452_17824 [Arctium lappa]
MEKDDIESKIMEEENSQPVIQVTGKYHRRRKGAAKNMKRHLNLNLEQKLQSEGSEQIEEVGNKIGLSWERKKATDNQQDVEGNRH